MHGCPLVCLTYCGLHEDGKGNTEKQVKFTVPELYIITFQCYYRHQLDLASSSHLSFRHLFHTFSKYAHSSHRQILRGLLVRFVLPFCLTCIRLYCLVFGFFFFSFCSFPGYNAVNRTPIQTYTHRP